MSSSSIHGNASVCWFYEGQYSAPTIDKGTPTTTAPVAKPVEPVPATPVAAEPVTTTPVVTPESTPAQKPAAESTFTTEPSPTRTLEAIRSGFQQAPKVHPGEVLPSY